MSRREDVRCTRERGNERKRKQYIKKERGVEEEEEEEER